MKIRKNDIKYDIFSQYRGALMGIAIISIIYFHFLEDSANAGLLHEGRNFAWLYFKYIGSSGVDVFLVLSGLGCYYSYKRKAADSTDRPWIGKRFMRVLPSYVLVALPVSAYIDICYKQEGLKDVIKDVSFWAFFARGGRLYWYILMICACYLIFPWIYRVLEEAATGTEEEMRLIILFCFISVIGMILFNQNSDFYNYVNIALLRFPVFFLGVYLGKLSWQKRSIPTSVWCLTFVIMFCSYWMKDFNNLATRYLNGAEFLAFSLWGMAAAKAVGAGSGKASPVFLIVRKVLEWFGRYSLEIYLLHVSVRTVFARWNLQTYHLRYELLMLSVSFALIYPLNRLSRLISGGFLKNRTVKKA